MQIPKTQGVATLRLAQEYHRASTAAASAVPSHSFVRYQLYGQAIELALKAFLITQGVTDQDLRKLGHDLVATLKRAQGHGAFTSVSLTEADIGVIEWLGLYYKTKDFSYIRVGFFSLPPLDFLASLS